MYVRGYLQGSENGRVVTIDIGDDFFFRAVRSLGAKQEGLTIVHFLNNLIVSCKEAVRFPF
jgi:hypothetical protein